MAQIVVRKLDEQVKRGLKRRAERHGRSMEEEVREILRNAVKDETVAQEGLGTQLAKLFAGLGFDFEIPELRGQEPRYVDFGDDDS